MSTCVCLSANTLSYPEGGGHLWVYLNWALGLRALGCRVLWLEAVEPTTPAAEIRTLADSLRSRLERYGLAGSVVLCREDGEPLPCEFEDGGRAFEADLLLNLQYALSEKIVRRFRRSALLDIDPGLLQLWMSVGAIMVARHDVYFTIGETVGQPGSRVPETRLSWQYTPPCVALDWWPPHVAAPDAPFTTVTHWHGDEWVEYGGALYLNDKRSAFLPFLKLPRRTAQPLELAVCLHEDEQEEHETLQKWGWSVRHAHTVTATPWDYQCYIQQSRGEFSCVKPSCIHLANAWISDRTLCYLASGKPAVLQHTGASRFLPDAAGLFRFRDMEEAVRCLETVAADYEHQCRLARALAAEFFDARQVVRRVLERTL
jgi:hypothetical protein